MTTTSAHSAAPDPSSLTYGSYLHVEQLLALQRPVSEPAHHDELLFILIHQVYELWFKQMLHELDAAVRLLDNDEPLRVVKTFRRIHAIQRVLDQQVDVLETMTSQDFSAFREHLRPASGFQSAQFREIETLCGLPMNAEAFKHLEVTAAERATLERRRAEPTLYDALKAYLTRQGFDVTTNAALVDALRAVYENDERYYALYLVLEDLIEFDERVLLWRGRHMRMAERMIGAKPGTGGSPGVEYLARTLELRFFPELWDVRKVLGTEARDENGAGSPGEVPAPHGGRSPA